MAGNPFFALQARVQQLLLANAYFAGLTADETILTEKIGDLATAVQQRILPLGFGVVVMTPEGKAIDGDYSLLISSEDVVVSIIHNPTTDLTHNALDALWAAIKALHGQPVTNPAPPTGRPFDFFAVQSHGRVLDAAPELHIHELRLHVGNRLM